MGKCGLSKGRGSRDKRTHHKQNPLRRTDSRWLRLREGREGEDGGRGKLHEELVGVTAPQRERKTKPMPAMEEL